MDTFQGLGRVNLLGDSFSAWLWIAANSLPGCHFAAAAWFFVSRFRELWLFLVAPCCLVMLLVCFAGNPSVHTGDVAARVFSKALQAYWRSRGELSTSVLRPFLQHMRLKPYLWYVVLDAAMSVWVFGQVYGYAAAASRWGVAAGLSAGLCWGLELYMRRLFVNTYVPGMLPLSEVGGAQHPAVEECSGKGKLD
jgi:hypothetical protein